MKTSFIIESFDEYVSGVYFPLNEAKDTLTENEVREIIDSLVMKQRKKALSMNTVRDLLKETFGESLVSEENLKKMRGDINWGDSSDVKNPEFFKKIQKLLSHMLILKI
jgi:hypothetical protein